MGAGNVEFHIQPRLAMVAEKTVVSSACEVGTNAGYVWVSFITKWKLCFPGEPI